MGAEGYNPTVFSAESVLPTDKKKLLEAWMFEQSRKDFTVDTAQRLKKASELVPEAQVSIAAGRVFNPATMVDALRERDLKIHDLDYPWGTTGETEIKEQKQTILTAKSIPEALSKSMSLFGAFLLHADPKEREGKIEEAVAALNGTAAQQLRIRLDADQFSDELKDETNRIIDSLWVESSPQREVQLLIEPSTLTFKSWEGFLRMIKDLREKYQDTNIRPLISLDLENIQPYVGGEDNVLQFIESNLFSDMGKPQIEISQIGAFELAGFSQDMSNRHDLPWKTPFELKKLFMLINKMEQKREGKEKLGIVIESHPKYYDDLLHGLPTEYVKVLKSVFN